MKIEEFGNNSFQAYIKAERYLNGGSPSGFSDQNTTSEKTRPKSSVHSFPLYQYKLNGCPIEKYGCNKPDYVLDDYIYIHPDIVPLINESLLYRAKGNELLVSPTASGRTVISIEKGFFVKLAYPKQLGRLVRHINSEKIISACEVTSQLISVVKSGAQSPYFSFLREDFGQVVLLNPTDINIQHNSININGNYELGVLFREGTPFPYSKEKEMLIPFFSLFCDNYNSTEKKLDKLLLLQLFEKQDKSIEAFLLEDVLFPLYSTYFDALLLGGIELEAHAQNMLIAIDSNYKIKRIVCRDLESAGRDALLMEILEIDYRNDIPYKLNTLSDELNGQKYPKYYITHSFMFDFKLGEYIVTPLLDKVQKHLQYNRDKVIKSIKDYNRQYINRLPQGFFTDDWCRYENVNWEKDGKTREYLWSADPKYRWVD